ncbi:hypothetical protein TWF106_003826 [Orbilia oligospora]|uniref:Uncharacterized protein n=1 Tax=Orbilia oligospora TaxID=2813651 RepID=A0A6G1LT01_ORBOL|nr:hypothetical protein TWF788_004060 [Orbilia oligospora]KAF3199388.1 hypothetical protein TWF106_003826 [Orbilia oligospora]KAF3200260.1 hypothetical protein TWF679_000833 [Orbilia oligospora]KAF3229080.1 hypothetical protein TWF191_001634 [Orbilia oligospora]KAF3233646.1 hypothetical protein TWF192_002071 [Orbilia oligospora]
MLSNRDRDPFMPSVTQYYHQQHHQNHSLALDAILSSSNPSGASSPARTPSRPRSLASPDSIPSTPVLKAWNPTSAAVSTSTTPQEEKGHIGRTIFINGYPGTGKLTVAKELQKIIPNSRVFDHHLLIDAARATFNQSDPEYQILRKAFRTTLLDSINTASTDHSPTTWIFTECQSNSHIGTSISHEYLAAAKRRSSPFVSIILTCSLEENLRRLSHPSRKTTPRRKLTNREVLKAIRDEEVIHRFGDWIGVRELLVDNSKLEPEEAAVVIKTFLEKIAVEQAMMGCIPESSSLVNNGGGGGSSSSSGSVGKRSGKRSRMGSVNNSREDVHMAGMTTPTSTVPSTPVPPSSSHGRTSIAALMSPASPIG